MCYTEFMSIIGKLKAAGLVAVIRGKTYEDGLEKALVAAKCGISAIEITFTTPRAERLISDLKKRLGVLSSVDTSDGEESAIDNCRQNLKLPCGFQGVFDDVYQTEGTQGENNTERRKKNQKAPSAPRSQHRPNRDFDIVAALTNPPKPGNRGVLQNPPAGEVAQRFGVPLLQFERVSGKEGVSALKALNADLMLTAAYGQILSEEVLSLFPKGVINVHASLLPKYRGAAPVQFAVMNGEKTTGVTIMRTVKEVDAGDIILQREVEIGKEDTGGSMFDKLAVLGAEAARQALLLIKSGKAVYTPQNHALATFTKMLKKSDGQIDFSKTAEQLDCFVRAVNPWPGAFCVSDTNSKKLKVFCLTKAKNYNIIERNANLGACKCRPGQVLAANAKDGLIIAVGGGAVSITELQAEGGRRMSAREFLKGNSIEIGTVFL